MFMRAHEYKKKTRIVHFDMVTVIKEMERFSDNEKLLIKYKNVKLKITFK